MSAEHHADLFTGSCLTYRRNIIQAIMKTRVTYKDIIEATTITTNQMCDWMNSKEPQREEISEVVEYLKSRGYEWK